MAELAPGSAVGGYRIEAAAELAERLLEAAEPRASSAPATLPAAPPIPEAPATMPVEPPPTEPAAPQPSTTGIEGGSVGGLGDFRTHMGTKSASPSSPARTASPAEDNIVELDGESGEPTGRSVSIAGTPRGLAFDPERGELWVSASAADRLVVVNPAPPKVVGEVKVPDNPREVRFGMGAIWVTSATAEWVTASSCPSRRAEPDSTHCRTLLAESSTPG